MMPITSWPAPAKLNLFIHVTGRRADGYHTLQTIFQFLDFADNLDIEATDKPAITLEINKDVGSLEDNICLRAARLLQQTGGVSQGVHLVLDKRIPVGGGLGGGSSDAATTLVALNELWGLHWPRDRLAELGAELGADVPVFVHGQAAWAEGVGDKLTPLPELPESWFVVVKPPVSVSTAEIYQAPELTRAALPSTIAGFLNGETGNCFEPVVRQRYPQVAEALDWLDLHATGSLGQARLTGTGACVFAAFASKSQAESALADLPIDWTGFVARGRNQSPLYDVH